MAPHIIYDTDSDDLPKSTSKGSTSAVAAVAKKAATPKAVTPKAVTTAAATKSPFRRPRTLHERLGGGKLADILLWRSKYLSAGILTGATTIWFLFEVVEYPFLTLMCHISIIAMLVVFIWSNVAAPMDWDPLRIPESILSEQAFRDLALSFHTKLTRFVSILQDIAYGKDLKLFLLAIASLWLIAEVGSYCSSLSLLYLGLLCTHTLPALYDRYQDEVNHLATRGSHDLKMLYKKIDSEVLDKIPRGPVKHKSR